MIPICKEMNMNLYLIFIRSKSGVPRPVLLTNGHNDDNEPIEAQVEPFLEGGHP
jgi:hypothetical protein